MGNELTTTGKDNPISPTLFGYLATSYYYNNSDISGAHSLTSIFNQSNSYDVANLFNGTKSSTETEAVYASLGISTISGLLDSSLVTDMGTDSGLVLADTANAFATEPSVAREPFVKFLFENDLNLKSFQFGGEFFGYKPNVLTIFYHCENDATIPLSLTTGAVGGFQTLGSVTVRKRVDFPTATHGDCPHALLPALCFAQIEAAGGDESALPDVADATNYCHGN